MNRVANLSQTSISKHAYTSFPQGHELWSQRHQHCRQGKPESIPNQAFLDQFKGCANTFNLDLSNSRMYTTQPSQLKAHLHICYSKSVTSCGSRNARKVKSQQNAKFTSHKCHSGMLKLNTSNSNCDSQLLALAVYLPSDSIVLSKFSQNTSNDIRHLGAS